MDVVKQQKKHTAIILYVDVVLALDYRHNRFQLKGAENPIKHQIW